MDFSFSDDIWVKFPARYTMRTTLLRPRRRPPFHPFAMLAPPPAPPSPSPTSSSPPSTHDSETFEHDEVEDNHEDKVEDEFEVNCDEMDSTSAPGSTDSQESLESPESPPPNRRGPTTPSNTPPSSERDCSSPIPMFPRSPTHTPSPSQRAPTPMANSRSVSPDSSYDLLYESSDESPVEKARSPTPVAPREVRRPGLRSMPCEVEGQLTKKERAELEKQKNFFTERAEYLPPDHPVYKDIILDAIKKMKGKNGSSKTSIFRYILKYYRFGRHKAKTNRYLCNALKELVKSKKIIGTGKGFRGKFKLARKHVLKQIPRAERKANGATEADLFPPPPIKKLGKKPSYTRRIIQIFKGLSKMNLYLKISEELLVKYICIYFNTRGKRVTTLCKKALMKLMKEKAVSKYDEQFYRLTRKGLSAYYKENYLPMKIILSKHPVNLNPAPSYILVPNVEIGRRFMVDAYELQDAKRKGEIPPVSVFS